MIHLNEAVIVEGKYDKIKLESILDAVIIETRGFSIFKDREQLELIRKLAVRKGIVIITDSDRAGFQIRNFLRGALPQGTVRNVYMPDIFGKEHRKSVPSKEGKLGVEGIPKEVILQSLQKAGILFDEADSPAHRITKTDLYEDGLTGGVNSAERRQCLLARLDLPGRLATNALLEILNAMLSYEEYQNIVREL